MTDDSTELRTVLARLRAAHRLANLGSWESDVNGTRLLTWSPEVFEIAGWPPDVQPTFEDFVALVHPDDRPLVYEARSDALADQRPFRIDVRIVRPDGQLRHLHLVAEIIRDDDGTPRRLIGAVQDRTEEIESLRRLRLLETSRRDLLQRVIDVAETERRRLARHLSTGPIEQLGEIERRLADEVGSDPSPEWTEALTSVRRSIESLHATMSTISEERPVGDLLETLEALAADVGVEVQIELAGDVALRPSLEAVVVRIAQESLRNIRKHARATRAHIGVRADEGWLHLSVTDDGCGFDPEVAEERRGHLGIVSMRERIAEVGGRLDIRSRPGRTTVEARIPLT